MGGRNGCSKARHDEQDGRYVRADGRDRGSRVEGWRAARWAEQRIYKKYSGS